MLVLWIDQNELNRKLLEKIFKNNKISFYSLDSANDFEYLVNDLVPDLIVIESQTALASIDRLQKQYLGSNQFNLTSIVIINNIPELDFIKSKKHEIKTPYDPFKLPEILKKIIFKN